MELTTFIHGSAHDLHQIADQSVQMIATSPPYYGLRAYAGEQGVEWPEVTFRLNEWVEPTTIAGCDPNCAHEWCDGPVISTGNTPSEKRTIGAYNAGPTKATQGAYCQKCGGWRCGLGMEPSPVAFIGHLILCLREWRRVLRDDGVCFVNLGDSYGPSTNRNVIGGDKKHALHGNVMATIDTGTKPKDLLGIPWLFAIAARADGWFLRSDIIWAKPNPMPESVTDRPTKAHEYVFLLSKSQRYFWDAEAVKESGQGGWNNGGFRNGGEGKYIHDSTFNNSTTPQRIRADEQTEPSSTRNLRSVWTIATQPTPFAHFATFPEKLVEPMIRAGSSERGACPHCGKAWVRVVERVNESNWQERVANGASNGSLTNGHNASHGNGVTHTLPSRVVETHGFAPACTCPAHEPVPCVVLDPFNGSGTTGKVAVQLGRAYVGVDIATEYLDGVTSERFGAGVQIGMGM